MVSAKATHPRRWILRKWDTPGPAAPRERVVLGAVAGIAKAGSRGGFVKGPVVRAPARRRLPASPALQPAASRAHDKRCPGRSGWGEALAARNRGERCRAAKAGRPLARETSAGAVLPSVRAARFVRPEVTAPPGGVVQISARARSGTRRARERTPGTRNRRGEGNLSGADRGSGGLAVVLVDCVDCRSRRAAHGPRLRAPGLASACPARSPSGGRGGPQNEAKARRRACPRR